MTRPCRCGLWRARATVRVHGPYGGAGPTLSNGLGRPRRRRAPAHHPYPGHLIDGPGLRDTRRPHGLPQQRYRARDDRELRDPDPERGTPERAAAGGSGQSLSAARADQAAPRTHQGARAACDRARGGHNQARACPRSLQPGEARRDDTRTSKPAPTQATGRDPGAACDSRGPTRGGLHREPRTAPHLPRGHGSLDARG